MIDDLCLTGSEIPFKKIKIGDRVARETVSRYLDNSPPPFDGIVRVYVVITVWSVREEGVYLSANHCYPNDPDTVWYLLYRPEQPRRARWLTFTRRKT